MRKLPVMMRLLRVMHSAFRNSRSFIPLRSIQDDNEKKRTAAGGPLLGGFGSISIVGDRENSSAFAGGVFCVWGE
jgi:hypothetical protein